MSDWIQRLKASVDSEVELLNQNCAQPGITRSENISYLFKWIEEQIKGEAGSVFNEMLFSQNDHAVHIRRPNTVIDPNSYYIVLGNYRYEIQKEPSGLGLKAIPSRLDNENWNTISKWNSVFFVTPGEMQSSYFLECQNVKLVASAEEILRTILSKIYQTYRLDI
jgi:hypothetical protein